MQFHDQTPSTIDKHLAYGIWFAAIVAGYACSKFISWLPGARKPLAALCCVAAFVYPAVASWQAAWQRYHSWPNSSEFVSDLKPIAAHSKGLIYMPPLEVNIAKYYTPQGYEWTRWNEALSFNPPSKSLRYLVHYYSAQLAKQNYGVIVLFYSTTFSSVRLPVNVFLSQYDAGTYQDLLTVVGSNSGEPGLAGLTLALETDPQYGSPKVGDYNTSNISGTHDYGTFAIWYKKENA